MFIKSKLFKIALSISLSFIFAIALVSLCSASGFIDGSQAQDYLSAPPVGPNVVGYMIGKYSPGGSNFLMFVRKCECLKRIDYANEGILTSHSEIMSQEEFNALNSLNLRGMTDYNGEISNAIGGEPGLIAVIDRVLEYKKEDMHFVARVVLKFVQEMI